MGVVKWSGQFCLGTFECNKSKKSDLGYVGMGELR